MRKWTWIVVGLIVALLGLVFTLQGIGTIKGSAMSGTTLWSILGPVIIVIGLAIAGFGWWREGRRARP
jgi:uncharacterized integral membrane protein